MKVSLFVWQRFRNRLPINDNLFKRDIITSNKFCVIDCGAHESTNYLFLTCNIFFSCHLVRLAWISSVDPSEVADQFVQFDSLAGFSKS